MPEQLTVLSETSPAQAQDGKKPTSRRTLFGWHARRQSREEKVIQRALKDLLEIIAQKHYQAASLLLNLTQDAEKIEELMVAIKRYNTINSQLLAFLENPPIDPNLARECLCSWCDRVKSELNECPTNQHFRRKSLTDLLGYLILADQEIMQVIPTPANPIEVVAENPRIQIPSDLIYQIFYALFPAERMIVVSGRRDGNTIQLGAAFDVTGATSVGHVYADPTLLGRALISMDLSNTHLAAWVHSHPGTGIQATYPSNIDLHQHADWIHDYSLHLLSAIVVRDRYIRFWGTALEEGNLLLDFNLPGLIEEKPDEHVYRITS